MAKVLGVHTPAELRNLAINGAFDYWQLVEGTTTTVNTATPVGTTYAADLFPYQTAGGTIKNFSVVRDSANIPTQAQSGFQSIYSYLFTYIGGTSFASPAAADYVVPISYRMEGLDYEKIHSKTITVGFWANPSVAGTYSFSMGNSAGNRSYVTTFSLSVGWQFVSFTVPLDTTGTWNFDNTLGLVIFIGQVSGTTFQTSTTNAWQAGNFLTATGATNWMATAGATLRIAQFSMIEGPLGLSATGFARQGRGIQQELALCQRYIEVFGTTGTTSRPMGNGQVQSSNNNQFHIPFAVKKRVNAVATCSAASHFNISNATNNSAASAFADSGCGVDDGWVTFTATSTALNAATFLTTNNAAGRLYFTALL